MKKYMVLILLVGLLGCEDSDKDTIGNAQSCIDTATPSTVNTCTAMVSGMTTTSAYLIRCSAHYIKQGFTTTRFVQAFNTLKNPPSGQNATLTTLGFMAFATSTGTDGATQTLSDCTASGVRAMQRLAILTGIATQLSSIAKIAVGLSGASPADMLTAVNNFVANGGDATTLGGLAVSASSSFCATGSSFSTNSVCTNLAAATAAGTSNAVIGQALLGQLAKVNQ